MLATEHMQSHIDPRKLMEHYHFESMSDGDMIRSCCRIHEGSDKSAFVMNAENGLWYCHTGDCGGGDVYDLVQKMEGISFAESVHWVAKFFNIDIEEMEVATRKAESTKEIQRWVKAIQNNKKSVQQPYATPESAKRVTKFRTFDKETIEHFGLVYVEEAQAEKRNGGTFTMRKRIGFPILRDGIQIGMSWRAVKSDDSIKWLHQPASIRTKEILYNYDAAIGSKHVVVVEGIPDTWAYYELGITAVGTFGAHLTYEQFRLLIKLGADITLSYDGDDAGREATQVAYDMLHKVANVDVIHFDNGEDPENISREELLIYYENKTR